MSTRTLTCRIIHRIGLMHDDRLALLVAVLNWAKTNRLTLYHFQSQFLPVGEFLFTVQIRRTELIEELLATLPYHAVEEVEIDGQSQRFYDRKGSSQNNSPP